MNATENAAWNARRALGGKKGANPRFADIENFSRKEHKGTQRKTHAETQSHGEFLTLKTMGSRFAGIEKLGHKGREPPS